MDPLSIHKSAFAALGMAQSICGRIIQPSGNRFARIGQRNDDTERFFALSKIGRSIERINNPAWAGQAFQNTLVSMDGLFAHNCHIGRQFGQCVSEKFFDLAIDHGDRIILAFHLDFAVQ